MGPKHNELPTVRQLLEVLEEVWRSDAAGVNAQKHPRPARRWQGLNLIYFNFY